MKKQFWYDRLPRQTYSQNGWESNVVALVCLNVGLDYTSIMNLSLTYEHDFDDTVVIMAGSDNEKNEGYIDKFCFVGIVKLDHIGKTVVINCYVRSVPTMKDKVVAMVKISNELIIITFQSLTNFQHWHTNNYI